MLANFLPSFADELEKVAFNPLPALRTAGSALAKQVGTGGAGLGLGALAGAGVGLARGGHEGYQQAKAQGQGTGAALLSGLGAGVTKLPSHALAGAAVGGALGTGAGLLGGDRVQGMARSLAGREDLLGKASRFGQRQVHGVTGAVPQGFGSRGDALNAMRTGAFDHRARFAQAGKALETAQATGGNVAGATKDLGRATRALEGATALEEMGATSLPGHLKALVTKPGQLASNVAKETWNSGGLGTKALTVGLPAATAAGSLLSNDNDTSKSGKFENAGNAIAPLVASGIMPMSGMLALGGITSGLAKTFGRGVDHARRGGPTRPMQAYRHLSDEENPPIERVFSERAGGGPGGFTT